MVTANELRIGNFIFLDTIWFPMRHKVMAQDIADIANGRITLSLLSPIPLTAEILEKCGFAKQDNLSYQLDAEFAVRFWSKKGNEVSLYYESDEMGQSIYSLHQLQNLYFALTSEELIINL